MVAKKISKKKSAPKKKKTSKRKTTTAKRTTTKRKGTTKIKYESTKEIKVDKAIINNFVALQKVLVNLSSRFDDLTTQLSKLLNLFEISAKTLAQKDTKEDKQNRDTAKIMQKLDNISQQAGLIGKGLALINEVNREKGIPEISQGQIPMQSRTRPRPPQSPQRRPSPSGMQGYQKSISTRVVEEHA